MTETSRTDIEMRRVAIPAGAARAGVFRRTYAADITDVWDACTDPGRLARWYQPVVLDDDGTFTQGEMGGGRIVTCEPPHLLVLALGDGAPDQVTLRLRSVGGGTELELEHATTFSTHEIAGGLFDAVYCMGGGYGPRIETLAGHLDGTLPEVDVTQLHLRAESRAAIQGSMAALEVLLAAEGTTAVLRPMG